MNGMELDDTKIEKLFSFRKIPYLLDHIQIDIKGTLLDQLFNVQRRIYELDSYLESNWDLDPKNLNFLWRSIYEAIEDCGYSRAEAIKLCKHIKRYELHEIQLREGKRPYRLSMEYFYYYKSCDVRLIRQIIMDKLTDDHSSRILQDWRYFDLATEVNDDIEDVFEDMHTINANAFLISINERSLVHTKDVFKDFLDQIGHKSKRRLERIRSENYSNIQSWTLEIIRDTKLLMQKNLERITNNTMNTTSQLDKCAS